MRFIWRWLKRLVFAGILLVLGLLSPVAYTELLCRPGEDASVYDALLDPVHHRAETRTLMTYPEWHIVHAYEDYGQVLASGDPHHFGFVQEIVGYWGSLCALSQASGPHGLIDGDTKQLVYVIGVSFTAELLLKAAYEETVGRLTTVLRGTERATLDELSASQAQSYAEFLQQVPWYKWDFLADAQSLSDARTESFRDRERDFALGLEYRSKAAYARVIDAAVAQVGPDALTLRMIVDGLPARRLAEIEGVTVIGETGAGLEVETVRYRALTHVIQKIANAGGVFVEIAGNDDIMFTVLSDQPTHQAAIYSTARQGFMDHRHLILTPVRGLGDALRDLADSQARLEHIHDY